MVVSTSKMALATPYASARKATSSTLTTASDSGIKKPMLPPSSLPPPRTGVKSKSSCQPKETKKRAKEQPANDSVAPLSGLSSRGMIATAQKTASRGNSSPSPHSTTSSHGEIRASTLRFPPKIQHTPGPKAKNAPSGDTELKLRIPKSSKVKKADNEAAKTLAVMEGAASRIAATSAASRNKQAISMSKSGVETSTKMDDTHVLDAASTPGSELPISPLPSAENITPIGLPQINPQTCIQDLENRLRIVTEEKTRIEQELSQMKDPYQDALHRIDLFAKENELFRTERDDAVAKLHSVTAEMELVRTQSEVTKDNFEISSTELKQLREVNTSLLAERTQLQHDADIRAAETEDFRQQLVGLESSLKTVTQEKEEALQRALASEEKMTKLLEDRDGVKKEAVSLKKKRQVEQEKAEENQCAMQKTLQDVRNEAQSWKDVAELRGQELHKLNKELELLKVVAEKHTGCDAEISRCTMKIQGLENKVELYLQAENTLQTSISEKEKEIRELRRRSVLLTQQKETLEYRLKFPAQSRHSLLMTSSLTFEPDSSFIAEEGKL